MGSRLEVKDTHAFDPTHVLVYNATMGTLPDIDSVSSGSSPDELVASATGFTTFREAIDEIENVNGAFVTSRGETLPLGYIQLNIAFAENLPDDQFLGVVLTLKSPMAVCGYPHKHGIRAKYLALVDARCREIESRMS